MCTDFFLCWFTVHSFWKVLSPLHWCTKNVLKDHKKTFIDNRIHFFQHIFDKNPVFITLPDFVNLEREFIFVVLNFFNAQQTFSYDSSKFKQVILSLWSSFIVEALGKPEPTFPFTGSLISNLCPNFFAAERNVFILSIFKIPLVKSYFPVLILQIVLF